MQVAIVKGLKRKLGSH
jgi:hypothetical protein